jgi:3'-phosphoadenosine 5'-phosphosulfate sulfotransferase (PAPS reductase)/FAD synthetase
MTNCGQLDLFSDDVTNLEVDVAAYDIILVNSSAGKDSQAMLDVIAERAAAAGVLDRLVVVHCDLGRVEWTGTLELAAEHAAHYGVRFVACRRELGDLLDQVEQRHESNLAKGYDRAPWPASNARWCTSDQKTAQVLKVMTALVAERREAGHQGPVRILNCLGIRAEESTERAKKSPIGDDTEASNGRRAVTRWLPIFDWTTEQVWDRIRAAGTRHHAAYDLGMSRLSCCFCVLASKPDLLIAAKANPELGAEYLAVEERTGKRFTMALSMGELLAEAGVR